MCGGIPGNSVGVSITDYSRLVVSRTYSAEEMANEDDELPWRDLGRIEELFEWSALSFRIQHQQIADALKVLCTRDVVVDVYAAFEVFLFFLQDRGLA